MPTPSTRTPVRIARGSYSNLNGSVSDLQDGEISYAEDQDKLYIKEGTSLVALTYTPASPAFTGTITGVNLTLSGNLTVNGTQTIINTQTLDVEDKQIEIGKVSSPSDTTADQGGIKLKGATDKTLLWVNATDAWTFNQNIEIASSTPSIKLKDGNGRNVEIIGGSTSTGPEIRTAYSGALRFGTNSLERMRLDTSGRLLLGTSVEGSAGADEFTINTPSGHGGMTIRNDSSSNGNIWFSDGTSGAAEYAGYIQYDHNADALKLGSSGAVALTLDSSRNATFAGSVSDSKGNLRSIPQQNEQGSAHVLVAADSGKHILADATVTAPPTSGIFSAGDAVTIINTSGSDISIARGSGVTMYNAADGSNADRTLGTKGMATILCAGTNTYYISGAGLS